MYIFIVCCFILCELHNRSRNNLSPSKTTSKVCGFVWTFFLIREVIIMKITKIKLGIISVPLRVPFKTALRSVNSVEDVIVEIHNLLSL